MKTNINLGLAAFALLVTVPFFACNPPANNAGDGSNVAAEDSSLSVVPVADSKQFPGAELSIVSITSEKVDADSAKLTVKYDVKNYTLTEHTSDSNAHHMANSAQGQHIHFILDNKPYAALYEPEHTAMVKLNSEHYLMSFLSRSYHESIKEPGASVLKHFKVDENGKVVELDIPAEPALFYSRPKGEYVGDDAKNILLDFYLVNTKLDDGNKVEAKINDTTITLDKWGPYEIQNAPKGELNVTLTLVDKDGNKLSGENTSVTRKVTLTD